MNNCSPFDKPMASLSTCHLVEVTMDSNLDKYLVKKTFIHLGHK